MWLSLTLLAAGNLPKVPLPVLPKLCPVPSLPTLRQLYARRDPAQVVPGQPLVQKEPYRDETIKNGIFIQTLLSLPLCSVDGEREKMLFSFPSPSGLAGPSSRVLPPGRLPSREQSCFL